MRGDSDGDGGGATGTLDRDVVVVGSGPAGASAGVFLGRSGLDTVVFDRGRSSIKQCAYLENYLGFPAGIDVETLYELLHDHVERAGCALAADLVTSVDRTADGDGFVVSTQEGNRVTARRVVAATRYDGEYLRGLDDDGAMFETYEHDGEEHQTFDRTYAARDGTTPVDGLYVASPSEESDTQAIVAAGRGARVARRVLADGRVDDGWWDDAAAVYDWVRPDDERADRETLVARFDGRFGDSAPVTSDSERYRRVREAFVDERVATYVDPDEVEARRAAGHATLAAHLDAEAILSAVDDRAVLDAMDDEAIRAYLDGKRDASALDD